MRRRESAFLDEYGSYKENFRTGHCTQTLEEIERDIAEELELLKTFKTVNDMIDYEMSLLKKTN